MSPAAVWKEELFDDARTTLIDMASDEIEQMRVDGSSCFPSFPPACLAVLKTIAGNHQCFDCGGLNPTWAAVHYGALLCLQCSGHHRSFGVQVSCVRSIGMDEWSPEHLLQMLEGGNTQIVAFFARHNLTLDSCPERTQGITKDNVIKLRYKTKAAEFYRTQLMRHATKVLDAGPYRGRDISRSSHARKHRQLDRRNTTE